MICRTQKIELPRRRGRPRGRRNILTESANKIPAPVFPPGVPLLSSLWLKPENRPHVKLNSKRFFRSIADTARRIGNEVIELHDEKGQSCELLRVEAMVRKAYELAAKGDAAARDFIANRAEGKVKEVIEQLNRNIDIGFE